MWKTGRSSENEAIIVLLERLNGKHLVSEREREKHTPLIFELERQKCPKLSAPSGEHADPRWTF